MIDHLRSYHFRDFLPFSRETLNAINIEYSQFLWPFQIPLLVFGFVCFFLIFKRHKYSAQIASLYFVISLTVIAYFYHLKFFVSINWAAQYIAYAIFLEAFILLIFFLKKCFIINQGIIRNIGIIFFFSGFILWWPYLIGWGTEATSLSIIGFTLLYTKVRYWPVIGLIPLCLIVVGVLTQFYLKA